LTDHPRPLRCRTDRTGHAPRHAAATRGMCPDDRTGHPPRPVAATRGMCRRKAVRPAAAYTDILKALDQASAFNQMFVWWAGWAPMLRDHDDLTRLMVPVANTAEPFRIAV
jgi:hypothetical protein